MIRVGIGYDIHRYAAGRRMVLCGVEFLDEEGLEGHSDADAALHAVTDAILGAAGMGDIGDHFPPGVEAWRDADSGRLLELAIDIVRSRFTLVNIDLTIIGERPKVAPRRADMRIRLATLTGLPAERVNIKATTNEQLGAIGRGEGLAALAVALLEERTGT
ncbi:MAG: 2-C-methyl-D-erythritol 2,4-cyclodiphosphate synthase [Thermomicrobiales bacterium]